MPPNIRMQQAGRGRRITADWHDGTLPSRFLGTRRALLLMRGVRLLATATLYSPACSPVHGYPLACVASARPGLRHEGAMCFASSASVVSY